MSTLNYIVKLIVRWMISYLILSDVVVSQIAFSQLSKVGVIKGKNYQLKITGESTYQLMVIKLVPNIGNLTGCGQTELQSYKDMIQRILSPIQAAVTHMRSVISEKEDKNRFYTAIVAGAALGIATSAQITAGIALHNSLENAKAIRQIKEAVRLSNQAIQTLKTAQQKTVLVINALQDQINSQLVPMMNTMGCQIVGNTLGLRLNQYFSELITIFGPNLREPATQTLSIQAISHAFNGDFDSLLRYLGYQGTDFMDLLESGTIRGRIIDVMINEFLITLQIEYPTLTQIPDATVQKFNMITYNKDHGEWLTIFPNSILKRGSYLSNIDISTCAETSSSIICPTDMSSPMSYSIFNCATGNLSSCARTAVVNSYAPRYALSQGVLFANCMPVNCHCVKPEMSIIQEPHVTNVMISFEYCEEILIDGIYISLGQKSLNRTYYAEDVSVGGAVSIDPIDLGGEIADIQDDINHVQDLVDKSNSILDRVNPNIVNANGFIIIIVFLVIFGIVNIILIIWAIYLTRKVNNKYYNNQLLIRDRSPTLASLSTISN